MYEQIQKHGENLLKIFPGAIEQDPVKLCKRMRRLESHGEQIALDYCNGVTSSDTYEATADTLIGKANKLLGNTPPTVPIFLNGDPRGYALKIRDDYIRKHGLTIHRDLGGYGILAPDLTAD